MRRSSHRPWHSSRAALLALAALAGSACAGTPLPEPPDNGRDPDELPRPIWPVRELATSVALPGSSDLIPVGVDRGGVLPDTPVWAINLDDAQVAPVVIMSTPVGSFGLGIKAKTGDRIRILSRTATQHSAPLDVVVPEMSDASTTQTHPVPLSPERVGCLTVTPPETLVLDGTTGELTLDNRCSVPITINRAQLRLGDQGIVLMPAPTEIAAGAEATLTFSDSRGPGATERLDILLLDVDAGSTGSGSYAIDVFSDLE
jgi:hypothetical protein